MAPDSIHKPPRPLVRAKSESSWLSAVLLFPVLSLFGELLIDKTHHRPLGAATFASVALLGWFCAEVFTRRALYPGNALRAKARKWSWRVGLTLCALLLVRALVVQGG